MLTNNQERSELRNIVNKVRVRVPPPNLSGRRTATSCLHGCGNGQSLRENYSNFSRSGKPNRFMCYESGSWVDLLGEPLEAIRSGFLERRAMVEVEIDGSKYLIDFYRMLAVDLQTEDQRSIAWIDVDGKCFFPKRFVISQIERKRKGRRIVAADEKSNEVPRIEIEITVNEKLDKNRKRMRADDDHLTESEGSSSNDHKQSELKKWKMVAVSECESARWPKAKLLTEEDKAYTIVKNLFLSGLGLGGATITAIHQYSKTGTMDNARHEVFQRQIGIIKAARGGEANMTFAWHGTSAKGVERILADGFGMPSKVPGPEARGIGVYLSHVRSSHVSAMLSEVDDNGEKHAILCRVILGKCEKVEAGSQQSYPSSVNFDSGVDDVANPKLYVVWCSNMNTHILPECVVSYRPPNQVSGQVNVLPVSKWMQNASNPLSTILFSKLGNTLPAPKALELRTLVGAYKGGRVAKDAFVRQLRALVGDNKLLSMVREIRG